MCFWVGGNSNKKVLFFVKCLTSEQIILIKNKSFIVQKLIGHITFKNLNNFRCLNIDQESQDRLLQEKKTSYTNLGI